MVPPELATAPSRAVCAEQMIQQGACSHARGSAVDERMGLRMAAEGVLWGANERVCAR
jgi:hypothetical protein